MQDSAYRRSGLYSASCAYQKPWGGLYFHTNTFNTAGYNRLVFYVNGGQSSGQELTINLVDANGDFLPSLRLDPYITGGSIGANIWRQAIVPLKALNGSNRIITGIVLQDALGRSQPRYYIDDMSFASQ